jgi:hypothetical protein
MVELHMNYYFLTHFKVLIARCCRHGTSSNRYERYLETVSGKMALITRATMLMMMIISRKERKKEYASFECEAASGGIN